MFQFHTCIFLCLWLSIIIIHISLLYYPYPLVLSLVPGSHAVTQHPRMGGEVIVRIVMLIFEGLYQLVFLLLVSESDDSPIAVPRPSLPASNPVVGVRIRSVVKIFPLSPGPTILYLASSSDALVAIVVLCHRHHDSAVPHSSPRDCCGYNYTLPS